MKIYVINLDRHQQRLAHMRGVLKGLAHERITAVDGTSLAGEETKCFIHERKGGAFNYLSRYEQACILSHLQALKAFLAGPDQYCCILEDDVLLGRDFPDFIQDETWIPTDAQLIKIETYKQPVDLGQSSIAWRGRSIVPLLSQHLGTAGYIVSRSCAQRIMAAATTPDRAMDYIVFGTELLQNFAGVYQLVPAICIQIRHAEGAPLSPEMTSSIRFVRRKPFLFKVKAELKRPLLQLAGLIKWIFTRKQTSRIHRVINFE